MIDLIGISGKKQAGKDTVYKIWDLLSYMACADTTDEKYYRYIVRVLDGVEEDDEFSPFWEKHAFAEILKDCVAKILGCAPLELEKEDFKESEIGWLKDNKGNAYTIRRLLQEFGTDVGRKISPMIWCMPLIKKYDYAKFNMRLNPYWIITDVRFECEAEEIKKRGGLLIRVNRPDMPVEQPEHESETALDNYAYFDEVLTNDGTLLDLVKKVDKIRDKHLL